MNTTTAELPMDPTEQVVMDGNAGTSLNLTTPVNKPHATKPVPTMAMASLTSVPTLPFFPDIQGVFIPTPLYLKAHSACSFTKGL
ncbi:MAG: hypothetical protein ACJ8BW_00945 [Ktedonobacteraceae bacterium]